MADNGSPFFQSWCVHESIRWIYSGSALYASRCRTSADDLQVFAGVLDAKLAGIALAADIPDGLVRAVCLLHRKPTTSPAYWQG